MQRRQWIWTAAWASCVLLSEPSLADSKATPAAAAFQASLDAYAAGDLRAALSAMRESYQLSGHTELLYNIARIEDELGSCSEALANFRLYLEKVPDGRYRAEAERATLELSARCPPAANPTHLESVPPPVETPAKLAPTQVEPRTPETRPERDESWWPPAEIGWTALALGAAAGAGAIYFTTRAVDSRDRFKASVDNAAKGGPPADFELRNKQHRAQTAAQVLAVSGGALAVSGLVVLLLGPKQAAQVSSKTTFSVAPGHADAALRVAF